jgi:hypothetical protein
MKNDIYDLHVHVIHLKYLNYHDFWSKNETLKKKKKIERRDLRGSRPPLEGF